MESTQMDVKITDECVACELCVETCPQVFEMGDGIARVKVDSVSQAEQDSVKDAAEQCPVGAIIIEE